jgi:hypothetical protein
VNSKFAMSLQNLQKLDKKKDEPPPPFFVVPLAANPKHRCDYYTPANYAGQYMYNIAVVSVKCNIGNKEDIGENAEN